MKRRGFMPNVRTYATMMSGYAFVDDWKPLTTQLDLVHSVYGQLRQHLERTRNFIDDDPAGESSASFILYPIALYISILGKAGQVQKAFDVFHELDTSGPLAPHPKIYSSLLSALAERVDAPDVDAEVIAQSVSEAKYIWRRHMRSLDSQPQHDVEPRSIEAMVKLLSRGNPPDHELMFDIVRDICGLPRPGDGRPPSPSSRKKNVAPTAWILNEIFDGCDAAGRPEMAVHYAQSVMDTRELRPILRARHLHKLLCAHILLAKKGSTLPSRSESVAAWVEWMVTQDPARKSERTTLNERTIASALELCHHCKDTQSALRIARAVILGGSPRRHRSTGSLTLSVRAWERLFHLATMAGADADAGQDEKRRCLELLTRNSYGGSTILDVWESTSAIERLEPAEKKAHVYLARHIVQVLKTVLPPSDHEESAEKPDVADLAATWSDIRKRAESFLHKTQRRRKS
jgi:pentatricopeptide repeat protein